MSKVAVAGRTGEWLESPGFGVYVHIPFCRHRCHYCDFNTYAGMDDQYEAYVDALVTDIYRWDGPAPDATSVFFGGGTPTLLPVESLSRILEAVRDRFGFAPDPEITIEANPEGVDERVFEGLLLAGFNRVSFGVQSLVPSVLAGLGRTHSPETARLAIAAARNAGFEDVNADLIYGSPWESTSDWLVSLEGILEIDPDHVSAYTLTIEEGTPLATLVTTGRVPDVDPDLQADAACCGRGAARGCGIRPVRDLELGAARPRLQAQRPVLVGGGLRRLRSGGTRPHRRTALVGPATPARVHRGGPRG